MPDITRSRRDPRGGSPCLLRLHDRRPEQRRSCRHNNPLSIARHYRRCRKGRTCSPAPNQPRACDRRSCPCTRHERPPHDRHRPTRIASWSRHALHIPIPIRWAADTGRDPTSQPCDSTRRDTRSHPANSRIPRGHAPSVEFPASANSCRPASSNESCQGHIHFPGGGPSGERMPHIHLASRRICLMQRKPR